MYFKTSIRENPATGLPCGYYRLVESYRNHNDRICHRTVLHVGFLKDVKAEQLNIIQKILTDKVKNPGKPLFEYAEIADSSIMHYVELFYNQMLEQGHIDTGVEKTEKKNKKSDKDYQTIDLNSLKNKDIREIGAEWMCYQALQQLQLSDFLSTRGWSSDDIQLAETHIISRAAHPASEFATARWIQENSAICEITGFDVNKVNKDRLYNISKKLLEEQSLLEQHLSIRTNELFDIEPIVQIFFTISERAEPHPVKKTYLTIRYCFKHSNRR